MCPSFSDLWVTDFYFLRFQCVFLVFGKLGNGGNYPILKMQKLRFKEVKNLPKVLLVLRVRAGLQSKSG